MPDERLDSMQQGIAPAPESLEAKRADAERRAENVRNPIIMEGAMGGTSDAERPGEQADMNAALHIGLPDDQTQQTGGVDQDTDTLQETREASLRAQGGGNSDEGDIRQESDSNRG